MVLDQLESSGIYLGLHERLGQAFAFLRQKDLLKLVPGRLAIEGDAVFALVQDYHSKPLSEIAWEAHRRHIDVQYLVAGQELIGHGHIRRFTVEQEQPERDLVALAGSGQLFKLESGQFAIFWPHDAHAPGLAIDTPGPVRKVVVKIEV